MRRKFAALTTLLLVLSVLSVNMPPTLSVESPSIVVSPDITVDPTLTVGMLYTVSIYTDCTNTDIIAYQITLSYNASVLEGLEVVNGDLIVGGSASFKSGTFNNTSGELSLTIGLYVEEGEVTSGPGTLAEVTFRVIGVGSSNITIGPETKLIGWNPWLPPPPDYNIIWALTMPTHIQDGFFDNTGAVAYPPFPPVAIIEADEAGFTNEPVSFSGAGSYDPDGTAIVSYDWNFGDRTTGTGVTPSHTYTLAGVYKVTLRVTDEQSQVSDAATHTIVVEDWSPFPVAIIEVDEIGFVDEPVSFSGAKSYDPDGTAIVSYYWLFGDDTTGTGVTPSHTYTIAGVYRVVLIVTDEQSEVSDPASNTIVVEVRLPFNADLADRKAWPEQRQHSLSKHGDINVLTAKVWNKGINPVKVKVVFTIYDGRRGAYLGELETDEITLAAGDTTALLTVEFDASAWGTPEYVAYIVARCWFGEKTPETPGQSTKAIRLKVVP